MKKTIILSIVIISIMYCCKKEDDCEETMIDIQNLETDYGCHNTKYGLGIDLTDQVTIIGTDAEYDTKVTGECHPDINFDAYNLVIGKQSLTYLNDTIIYTYKRACPDEVLTLTVDIIHTTQLQHDTVVYHAIVPKPTQDEQLSVLVNFKFKK
jgi:hypothetical protein